MQEADQHQGDDEWDGSQQKKFKNVFWLWHIPLVWLNNQCNRKFIKQFVHAKLQQRIEEVQDLGRRCAAGKVKIPREVPGKIYYEPDTGDDWDDGDPDDDLVSNIEYLILKESSNKWEE